MSGPGSPAAPGAPRFTDILQHVNFFLPSMFFLIFVDFVFVVVVKNNTNVYIINLLSHGCLVHTILFTRETFHSLARYARSFVKCLPRS